MSEASHPELVQVLETDLPAGSRWQPMVGPETIALLDHLGLPPEGRERYLREAVSILSRCIPPTADAESDTGLAVGYVQSGKTMSFTTLTALARDNEYRLVIVISGSTTSLFRQSSDRLQADLRLQARADRAWQPFKTILRNVQHRSPIENALAQWNAPPVPEVRPRTVLITAMKNHAHLNSLMGLLQTLGLSGVPALVVDDEGDQASLNNRVRQGAESTTYSQILALRQCLPLHTYVQYTATPQAPLLINIIDSLSPRFAEVLTPGEDYVGGKDFFPPQVPGQPAPANPHLVETIPNSEIPSQTNRLVEPPDSLLRALRLYFLGVAAGVVVDHGTGNRSMMVHPSQQVLPHAQYFDWVQNVRNEWIRTIQLPDADRDRRQLVEDFQTSYEDLRSTAADLPDFDALLARLLYAFRETRVVQVNAAGGTTPSIDWHDNYSYILVGGEVLSRGYTVEGLTVTYMPRGPGVQNADTIEQRARFLGYKRRYLGYCRVFLENNVSDAYRDYVEHEEDVRERLIEHRDTGSSLAEWKRALVLAMTLRPTRASVLDVPYSLDEYRDEWVDQKSPHESNDALGDNRLVIRRFLATLAFQADGGDTRRTPEQVHNVATGISLQRAYDDLVTRLRIVNAADSVAFTRLLIQVERHLRQAPDEVCTIFHMSRGAKRQRGVRSGRIVNLYQGRNPRGTGPAIYPGDAAIRGGGLTIQVHELELHEGDFTGPLIAVDVPTLAVWVPQQMAVGVLVQRQG